MNAEHRSGEIAQSRRPVICINALALPSYLSGIGTYTYHLVRLLSEKRIEWQIELWVNDKAAHNFLDIPGITIREVTFKSRFRKLWFLHVAFPMMTRQFALVHSVHNVGLLICRTLQVITIHDCYECVSPERFPWFQRRLNRFLISFSGRGAAHIITDSKHSQSDIEKYYPPLSSKTSVVYLGNKFSVERAVTADNREGFLFVGTIEPGKNLELVLEAFARFRRLHGGRLRVVGARGWSDHAPLLVLIASLGIADAVEFLGFVSDDQLRLIFQSSVALIQASNYEGFGLPVIEAMACGCPVIAARNSGLVEAGGDSAVFFRTKDCEDLLRKMEAVFTDRGLRERCIRSGFDHASRFSWERTIAEIAGVYQKCLYGKPAI